MWVSLVQQHESAIHIHPLPLEPPPHPSAALSAIAEQRAEPPVLFSSFPLAICLARGGTCISVMLPQFTPPSPSPPFPPVCSLRLCLYSCPPARFICTIFLESIYILIDDISFSFSDSLHSITGSRFIHVSATDSNVFLFVAE